MPFPVEIAGFPDFSRPVPVYPAFLKYVVPVHSFPRPLSAAEEKAYLERFAAGDLEARNVLIEHNLRLVAHILKKMCSKMQISLVKK